MSWLVLVVLSESNPFSMLMLGLLLMRTVSLWLYPDREGMLLPFSSVSDWTMIVLVVAFSACPTVVSTALKLISICSVWLGWSAVVMTLGKWSDPEALLARSIVLFAPKNPRKLPL